MTFNVDDLEVEQKPYVEKDSSEFKIHVAIFEHISGRKRHGKEIIRTTPAFNAFVSHVYQGRSREEGFFLKLLGVIAGVADLIVLWRAKCVCGVSKVGIAFLEVKKPGGIQSTPQKKFQGICHWLGVNYAIVKSVREAHDVLVKWGCPANHNSPQEPDTRTFEQKKKDSFEMYKR